MIETYKNVNISAEYQQFCTKPSEQGLFFRAGQNESKEWYAMIKTYKKHKYLNRDEFSINSKVNYTSEDLLPVTVTSRLLFLHHAD